MLNPIRSSIDKPSNELRNLFRSHPFRSDKAQYLWEEAGISITQNILTGNDYLEFKTALKEWHVEAAMFLYENASKEHQIQMRRVCDNFGLINLARRGFRFFTEMMCDEQLAAQKAEEIPNAVFMAAAQNGRLSLMQRILPKLSSVRRHEVLTGDLRNPGDCVDPNIDTTYNALRFAAGCGHSYMVKYILGELTPDQRKEAACKIFLFLRINANNEVIELLWNEIPDVMLSDVFIKKRELLAGTENSARRFGIKYDATKDKGFYEFISFFYKKIKHKSDAFYAAAILLKVFYQKHIEKDMSAAAALDDFFDQINLASSSAPPPLSQSMDLHATSAASAATGAAVSASSSSSSALVQFPSNHGVNHAMTHSAKQSEIHQKER